MYKIYWKFLTHFHNKQKRTRNNPTFLLIMRYIIHIFAIALPVSPPLGGMQLDPPHQVRPR